jgi:hypothetical protein
MKDIFTLIAAVTIAIGAGFGVACLFAWAVTSIWPSIPFWPVALGVWAFSALLPKGFSK